MQFPQVLKNLMDSRGLSNYQLAKELDIHPTTVANWLGGKLPRKKTQLELATYFNVSVDYLMGNEQKEAPAHTNEDERDITFNDFTYALHNETKELTEENKQKLLEMARFFKEQQDKNKKQ